MRSRKDNRGRVWVCLDGPPVHTSPYTEAIRTVTGESASVHTSPHSEPNLYAVLREEIATLRAALERQEQRAAAERAAIEKRADAEIDRLAGQFHAERAFWTERADAAECRADQATAALNDLINRILATIPPPQLSLWRRLFGG